MPAGSTDMMRPLQLAAIRAFRIGGGAKGMMRTPHVAARGRGFLFWNSHDRLEGGGKVAYLDKFGCGGNSDASCSRWGPADVHRGSCCRNRDKAANGAVPC